MEAEEVPIVQCGCGCRSPAPQRCQALPPHHAPLPACVRLAADQGVFEAAAEGAGEGEHGSAVAGACCLMLEGTGSKECSWEAHFRHTLWSRCSSAGAAEQRPGARSSWHAEAVQQRPAGGTCHAMPTPPGRRRWRSAAPRRGALNKCSSFHSTHCPRQDPHPPAQVAWLAPEIWVYLLHRALPLQPPRRLLLLLSAGSGAEGAGGRVLVGGRQRAGEGAAAAAGGTAQGRVGRARQRGMGAAAKGQLLERAPCLPHLDGFLARPPLLLALPPPGHGAQPLSGRRSCCPSRAQGSGQACAAAPRRAQHAQTSEVRQRRRRERAPPLPPLPVAAGRGAAMQIECLLRCR